jgi:hypothetical protein
VKQGSNDYACIPSRDSPLVMRLFVLAHRPFLFFFVFTTDAPSSASASFFFFFFTVKISRSSDWGSTSDSSRASGRIPSALSCVIAVRMACPVSSCPWTRKLSGRRRSSGQRSLSTSSWQNQRKYNNSAVVGLRERAMESTLTQLFRKYSS